jgi:serine/threonine protein phosphatase 1
MLLAFLQENDRGGFWLRNGGLETLHSYGIDLSNTRYQKAISMAPADLANVLPESHTSFLLSLRLTFTVGDYFFCHAGVRPGIPLQNQRKEDLLWIRGEFLKSNLLHEKVIVHGHTPVREPEIKPNRINVDTGAYMSGILTCLVLEGSTQRFIATGSNSP